MVFVNKVAVGRNPAGTGSVFHSEGPKNCSRGDGNRAGIFRKIIPRNLITCGIVYFPAARGDTEFDRNCLHPIILAGADRGNRGFCYPPASSGVGLFRRTDRKVKPTVTSVFPAVTPVNRKLPERSIIQHRAVFITQPELIGISAEGKRGKNMRRILLKRGIFLAAVDEDILARSKSFVRQRK